ncbi:hypothetical protein GA0070610_0890 [Micromonospora echinofusca]|uniref:Uncharacterized protein n=1 Tax=Micromonospora echinofusca TaxID=47858 RepID=A0A1C5G4P4_MICEH|nr:hypothetical protein GA0070610_0890 [Micromonospora echinofusca]
MQERHDMRRRSKRRGFTHSSQRGQRIAHTRAAAGGNRNTDRTAASASR